MSETIPVRNKWLKWLIGVFVAGGLLFLGSWLNITLGDRSGRLYVTVWEGDTEVLRYSAKIFRERNGETKELEEENNSTVKTDEWEIKLTENLNTFGEVLIGNIIHTGGSVVSDIELTVEGGHMARIKNSSGVVKYQEFDGQLNLGSMKADNSIHFVIWPKNRIFMDELKVSTSEGAVSVETKHLVSSVWKDISINWVGHLVGVVLVVFVLIPILFSLLKSEIIERKKNKVEA